MNNSFHKYSRIFLSLALAGAPVLIALAFIMSKPAYAEAVMYSAQNGYCEKWKTNRSRFPQKNLGSAAAECKTRAAPESGNMTTCRLKSTYVDEGTGTRFCVYSRGGLNKSNTTMTTSPSEQCLKSYSCDAR